MALKLAVGIWALRFDPFDRNGQYIDILAHNPSINALNPWFNSSQRIIHYLILVLKFISVIVCGYLPFVFSIFDFLELEFSAFCNYSSLFRLVLVCLCVLCSSPLCTTVTIKSFWAQWSTETSSLLLFANNRLRVTQETWSNMRYPIGTVYLATAANEAHWSLVTGPLALVDF